jgi:hypothetical protein
MGGVLGRLAARKYRRGVALPGSSRRSAHSRGTKVLYTAHGLHFYKGAPFANWIIYYPIEKFLARYTDVLFTINREDYDFAKRKLRAGRVVYVPGVGIDTEKFAPPVDCLAGDVRECTGSEATGEPADAAIERAACPSSVPTSAATTI